MKLPDLEDVHTYGGLTILSVSPIFSWHGVGLGIAGLILFLMGIGVALPNPSKPES